MKKYIQQLIRKNFINIVMAIGTLILCVVAALVTLTPQTYDVKQGEISPETITATENFIDEKATQRLKEAAQAEIEDIYVPDPEISKETSKQLTEDFSIMEEVRAAAEQYYTQHQQDNAVVQQQTEESAIVDTKSVEKTSEGSQTLFLSSSSPSVNPVLLAFVPSEVAWEVILTETEMDSLKSKLPSYLDEEDLLAIISTTENELEDIKNLTIQKVQKILSNGINESNIETVLENTSAEVVQRLRLSLAQEEFLQHLLQNTIEPNMVYDAKATEEAKTKAAEHILPVEYKKGQNIVFKGDLVTAEQYELLKDRMLLSSEITSVQPYYAVIIYIALVFVLYILFLIKFNRRLIKDIKKVGILCILTALSYLVTMVTQLIHINIYPIFLFVILAAVLLSPKNAIVYTVFLSLLMMSVTTAGQEMMSRESLILLLNSLLGGLFAVYMLKEMRYRSRLLIAGFAASIPGIVIALVLWLYKIYALEEFAKSIVALLASGVLCGTVSIGVLPIMENMFKLVTPTKLLELSDPNHVLIKRLMVEAPGTYHHSMLVANLAEAACEVVGGYSLLARVGAYYHDVGKVKNPLFFTENQRNNFNPHDNLSPAESMKILKKHVTDGAKMLQELNMPEVIIRILEQHHGNSVATFFYGKALKENRSPNVEQPHTAPVQ